MSVVPVAEVHRSKLEADPVKKTSAKLESEIWWGMLQGNKGGSGSPVLPYLRFQAGETRDSIKQKNSANYAGTMHFSSNLAGRPGGWFVWKCDQVAESPEDVVACPNKFRWTPSFGVEYYDSLPVERNGLTTIESINTTVGVARVGIEYWPFLFGRGTVAPAAPLQLLMEYSYRPRLGGDRLPDGAATYLTIGLNYYFDASQAVGLGVEHENGESPVRNFQDEERTFVSIKVKF